MTAKKTSAKGDYKQPVLKREPVSVRQLELMLIVFLRSSTGFLAANGTLKEESFSAGHRCYAVMWGMICAFHETFDNDLPSEEFLAAELEQVSEDVLTDAEIDVLDDFLSTAFSMDEDAIKDKVALRILKNYMEDRLTDQMRVEIASNNFTPRDIFALATGYRDQAASLGSIQAEPIAKPFADDWILGEDFRIEKVSCGIDDLDLLMCGGIAKKEVMGLLGPHGSCKTLMAIQIICTMAANARALWIADDRKGPLPMFFYFFYEGTIDEMRLRSLAFSAKISRESLEMGDMAQLSTKDNLKGYEQRLFADYARNGIEILGEQERLLIATKRINDNVRFIDMTGNDPLRSSQGYGSIEEVESILRANDDHVRNNTGEEAVTGGFVIDYVGAMAKRYKEYNNFDDAALRHAITGAPYAAKHRIAIHRNCTALLLHQLSGAANELAPGKVAHGTKSAESRTFRENLDFNFVIGAPDREGHVQIQMDKQRRTGRQPAIVVRIHGKICAVLSTNGKMVVDNGSIIPAEALHMIQGNDDSYDDDFTAADGAVSVGPGAKGLQLNMPQQDAQSDVLLQDEI